MGSVHEYVTIEIDPIDLTTSHTLVGECGGLSSVLGDAKPSYPYVEVETEHGSLFLDPDMPVEVLA